ncbi:MAG: hypothetical protein GY842_29310 [bacterium]|nr:hypothetical protein [bacterium]
MGVELRELAEEDFGELPRLMGRVYGCAPAEDGVARLRWLLCDNPDADESIPKGWVLCDGGRIVGLLANVPRRMVIDGASVRAACTAHYVVLPEYRVGGLRLANAYFEQRGADCLFVATGNRASAAVFRRFGAESISEGDQTAMFVLRGGPVCAAKLRRRGWNAGLAKAASIPTGLSVGLWGRWQRRRLSGDHGIQEPSPNPSLAGRGAMDVSVRRMPRFDTSVDALGERCGGDYRVTSRRDSQRLNWLFVDGPTSRRTTLILGLIRAERLDGYVVLQDRLDCGDGVRRSYVMDLVCSRADAEGFAALVRAGLETAREMRRDTLEFPVLGQERAARLAWWGAWRRRLDVNPFMFRALNGAPKDLADRPEAWYIVGSDGDGAAW